MARSGPPANGTACLLSLGNYRFVLTSTGTSPARANLSVASSLGLPVQLFKDTTLDGVFTPATLQLMATDSDGDGTFETIETGFDNDFDGRPDPDGLIDPGTTYEVAIALSLILLQPIPN